MFFFLLSYQNVRTTGVSTAEPEGLRIAATTIIVITVSALDGSVFRGLPAQEWQHHVRLTWGVVPIIPAGYMVDTPQYQTVRPPGRCILEVITTAVLTQEASKWEIVVHITCTILMAYLLVMPVTVARTRHKCKQSIYVYIFYHFTKVGFIVITK